MEYLVLDPGHMGTSSGLDCGAVSQGYKEADLTLAISKAVRDKLSPYKSKISVVLTREGNLKQELKDKAVFCNKYNAKMIISIHINAGGGLGAETFTLASSGNAYNYAKIIHSEYIQKTGLKDRGLKQANFYMLRETKAPAILIECFFIDSSDISYAKKIDTIADGIADGILKAYGIPKVDTPVSNAKTLYYRVIAGSFTDKKNAENKKAELERQGHKGVFLEAFYK